MRCPRINYPVLIGSGTTVSPIRTGGQEICSPKDPTGPEEVSNDQILHTFIHVDLNENWYPMPSFSKIIVQELSHDSSVNIYSHCQMNFTRNFVGTEIPNFMNLELPAAHTLDELRSFSTPATRVISTKDGFKWSTPGFWQSYSGCSEQDEVRAKLCFQN